MIRSSVRMALAVLCLAMVLGAVAFRSSTDPAGASVRPGRGDRTSSSPIEHIVLIMKENRSFDHYFGKFPGVNGATTGRTSDGSMVTLGPASEALPNDIGHSAGDFYKAFNRGLNDGFDLQRWAFSAQGENLPYTQMDQASIPNYWAYASRYGLGDNMFSDFHGPSFANNLYEVAAQAGRYDPALDYRSAWSIPLGPGLRNRWGCDAPETTKVTMMSPNWIKSRVYPCFGFRALPNILAENGVSWSMYSDDATGSFAHNSLQATTAVRDDPNLWSNVRPPSQFLSDAQAGTLPAVSWLILPQTEHPPMSTCMGENQTVEFVNAVMTGPQWSSTAIFVVWDEWGGFYDHVPPPQIDNISYGFRMPLIVISPWTKYGASPDGGYVSSVFYTHASFIRFAENNWSLPSLGAADVTANGYEDFFDYAQTPKDPLVLQERTCQALTPEQKRMIAKQNPD